MKLSAGSNLSPGQQKKTVIVPFFIAIGLVILIGIPFAVQATTTPRIAAGAAHVIALKSNGTVWSWGRNAMGQLGVGSTTDELSPRAVSATFGNLSSATAVASGFEHSMALKSDTTMVAWGNYSSGQLGNYNLTANAATPVSVVNSSDVNLTAVTSISAGYEHSIAIIGGTVYTWGDNFYGQLGYGTNVGTHTANSNPAPVTITGTPTITAIAAGSDFTLALDSSGTVWAWGNNSDGQLGQNPSTTSYSSTPTQISGLSNVKALAAGFAHALAVDSSGKVYAWGYNSAGQLGQDTSTASNYTPQIIASLSGLSVSAVSAGYAHSMALTSSGNVYAWGAGAAGQLGLGSSIIQGTTPQQVTATGFSGVSAISSGEFFSVAIDGSGNVWTWGENGNGELGNGGPTGVNVYTPTSISFSLGSTGSVLLGDMNNSGKITAGDALLALQYSVGINTLNLTSADALARGDVNSSGKVTAADALLILQKSVGISSY